MWKWRREQVSGQQDSSIRCYIRLRSDERNVSIPGGSSLVYCSRRTFEGIKDFFLCFTVSCYIGPCTMIAQDYRHPISSINSIKSDSYSAWSLSNQFTGLGCRIYFTSVTDPLSSMSSERYTHQITSTVTWKICTIGMIQTSFTTRSISNNTFVWLKIILQQYKPRKIMFSMQDIM